MKIIQINTVYGTGSTGKIVASLYSLAEKNGFAARVAYGRGNTPKQNNINGYLIGSKPDFYSHVLYNFVVGSSGFASKKKTEQFLHWLDNEKPDLLHLHNLHGFYIHVGLLFDYIKEKNIPVVWTLHDCWTFTGQCSHFDYIGCEKWKNKCHNCPIFRTDYPYSILRDNSRHNFEIKKEAFTSVKNLTIVTPSQWLANLVKQSFLKDYPVEVIANGIDLNIFKPKQTGNTKSSQKELHRILLAVANVWDKRKGLTYLLKLSDEFNPSNGYQIVIIGLTKKQIKNIKRKYKENVLALPKTSSQKELVSWYQKASVYVNPSLQESFSLTNVESLACGTPTVSYNSGGTPETILSHHQLSTIKLNELTHSSCGILVPKGNYKLLRKAITEINDNPDPTRYQESQCRSHALSFDSNQQFEKYIKLYRQILQISTLQI